MSNETYRLYISNVLKQVHPDTGMSGEALSELDILNKFLLEKVMETCNALLKQTKKATVSSRDVQTAVRLVLPGELAKHAVSESTKAVTRYNSASTSDREKKENGKTKAVSRSFLAGLVFSVARTERLMRKLSITQRMGSGAPVYLAATLEYIMSELLELSGNCAHDSKKIRISPRHITMAIHTDEELSKLFSGVTLGGGVLQTGVVTSSVEDRKTRTPGKRVKRRSTVKAAVKASTTKAKPKQSNSKSVPKTLKNPKGKSTKSKK